MSCHHVVKKRFGGTKTINISIERHALIHYENFLYTREIEEYNAFTGQLGLMSEREKDKFYKIMEKQTGNRVKFID
jgi:hypothetical protein